MKLLSEEGRLLAHVALTKTGTCSGCCFEDFTCKASENLKGLCFREGGIFRDLTDLQAAYEEGFKAGVEHGHRSFGVQACQNIVRDHFRRSQVAKKVAA
jgi:hypothetical protein